MPAAAPHAPAAAPIAPSRLAAHLHALEAGLLQRQTAVHLLLLAALAGEHVLLIGPPGTAKSALARRLHRVFDGARWFERLLTRFSTPEELFGPLSLKALEDDRYERLVDGWLPTAGIAFLDEVFKANSAILNALLTLLNERVYDNGSGRLPVPLISLVGASNEGPGDESLQAFHDRFLLRVPVQPVDDAHFTALLRLPAEAGETTDAGTDAAGAARPGAGGAAAPAPITVAERAALRRAAAAVALGDEALDALQALRQLAAQRQLPVSDRRWRQLLQLMRCAAAAEGRATLDALDLWLAPYALAAEAAQLPPLLDWVATQLAGAVPQPLDWLGHAVQAFERQLELEQRQPAEGETDAAGKLALAQALGGHEARAQARAGDDGLLRVQSRVLEDKLRRRYSPVHVAARVAQVQQLADQVAQAQAEVQARHDALAARLAGRLWLPPELAAQWLGVHRQTLARLQAFGQRLAEAQAGFAAHPQDATLPAQAPLPVRLEPAAA